MVTGSSLRHMCKHKILIISKTCMLPNNGLVLLIRGINNYQQYLLVFCFKPDNAMKWLPWVSCEQTHEYIHDRLCFFCFHYYQSQSLDSDIHFPKPIQSKTEFFISSLLFLFICIFIYLFIVGVVGEYCLYLRFHWYESMIEQNEGL